MKILVYCWKAYSTYYAIKNMKNMGIEVAQWEDEGIENNTEEALLRIKREVGKGYDAVFSYNYFKTIAVACEEKSIPYIIWTQDAPLLSLYDETTFYETNHFYCFDSEQFQMLRSRGIKNVTYCPLAVDAEALYKAASEEKGKKFSSQVSFVGSLYSEKGMFETIPFSPYLKGYMEGIVNVQCMIPQIHYSELLINENIKEMLRNIQTQNYTLDELMDNLIDRQVTTKERHKMLTLFPNTIDFKIYTNSDTTNCPTCCNCGPVDYYKEMPCVFQNSDVNLNITLRSIRKGIPLRVLDVIASGGFLVTNLQEEMYWFFEEGRSIVTFQGLEEMKEKTLYYLERESERLRIIENGRKIIKETFDFSVLLPQILHKTGIM